MRIPSIILKSVGFIGEVTHEGQSDVHGDLCATGFFVCVPFKSPELSDKRVCYFVTAAHVAKSLSDRPIYFLVNKQAGGVTGLQPIHAGWGVHPTDRTADVVAVQVLNPEDGDIATIRAEDLVTPDDISAGRVAVGDEVFITGLFTEAPGTTRNMPIVRHGNIAMIPEEQIQTDMGYADAFLIEARSIGGLSGSPVFVRPSIEIDVEQGQVHVTGPIKVLGLMQGHWDIRESEMNEPSIVHDRKRGVNLGIGVVVPAAKILETINGPGMIRIREEYEEIVLKGKQSQNLPVRQ